MMLQALSLLLCSVSMVVVSSEENCKNRILVPSRRNLPAGSLPPLMPEDLKWAYTRCGSIPTGEYFVDDSNKGRGTHYRYSAQEMERQEKAALNLVKSVAKLALLPAASTTTALNGKGLALLAEALRRHSKEVVGKHAVVFGSQTPIVETLLLAMNVSHVTSVEYNRVTYNHSKITTITPEDLDSRPENERRFDFGLSISSFDHDGLGRYGDPLAPDGDLMSQDNVRDLYLKPGGLYFLTVPIGPDVLVWNLHRRYGTIRLPLLLDGWVEVERVGWEESYLTTERPFTKTLEPVFVLRSPKKKSADNTEENDSLDDYPSKTETEESTVTTNDSDQVVSSDEL